MQSSTFCNAHQVKLPSWSDDPPATLEAAYSGTPALLADVASGPGRQ